MTIVIFSDLKRLLESEAARYRSIAGKERPDLVEQGYFECFEPVKKSASRCDGFIPNHVRLFISCASGGQCPAFCQRP